MADAQRVVDIDAAGGVAIGLVVGRIERGHRRRGGIAGQGEGQVDRGGGFRRAVGGQQLQVRQAAHVETVAAGVGCEYLQACALRVDHIAVGIGLEIAGAGIHLGAVGRDGEEAFAGDRQVQAASGRVDIALRELLGHVADAHARTDRIARQAVAGALEHVGKLGARFLEPGRVDVGDVVGGDVQIGIGCVDAGQRGIEAHGRVPLGVGCRLS